MRPIAVLAAAMLAGCTQPGVDNASNQATESIAGNEAMPPEADANAVVVAEAIRGDPSTDVPPALVPASDDGEDQCGARKYQSLVGKKKSEIPPKPAGATWRVACNSCPVTMDYSEARLNIFYDTKTEIIESVRCG